MDDYSIQKESARILHDNLLCDQRLELPPSFTESAEKITFIGDPKPFIPTPCKITESASSLTALLAAAASAVAADRYGIGYQKIEVNT